MRSRWLSLTALLLGSAAVLAQQPGAQPPQVGQQPAAQAQPYQQPALALDPANNKLDDILLKWEKAMGSINTLQAELTRTAVDKTFLSTEKFAGVAKYQKPNKASLTLVNQDPKKSQEFERLVCNAQVAYVWVPSQKEIQVLEMPKPKQGQINDDNFVSMLFGMTAVQAKRRYDLQLLPDPQGQNFYYYIQVLPRDPQDRAEFTKARLVLNANTNLPRQIWFEQPNGNETTWDFPKLAPNVAIDPNEFGQPQAPQGWQLKRVAQPDGARVIRSQQ